MNFDRIKNVFIGNPLTMDKLEEEKIPKWKALAVLSSDALSSVAYATEEVLIPLSLFAISAMAWSMPMALAVGVLLLIITLSYQQTITAYPHGGGAYTVARENLGENAGLVAGAALLIDYTLTVSVSISAGIENIGSAFPFIGEHKVFFVLFIFFLFFILILLGIKESSNFFAYPTYFFIFSILILIVTGTYKIISGEVSVVHPVIHESYPEVPLFLLLRAFSSGCSALTGIEAISNGVPIFRKPSPINAKVTMIWMAVILGGFFLGITLLAHSYGIVPTHGGKETVMSLLAKHVFGSNVFYYATQMAVALILLLAANTSYADFPRLTSLMAHDRFLPKQMSSIGDRLVFSNGIIGLTISAALLLVIFKGSTHALIPLYAVGVFLSFTLSQSGMIIHHIKTKAPHWKKGLVLNSLGAMTTFVVLLVIGITKFTSGAYMVIILIPTLVLFFKKIKEHYQKVSHTLARENYHQDLKTVHDTYVAIVPISGIHPGVVRAVKYAMTISKDVRVCYVDVDKEATAKMMRTWEKWSGGLPLTIIDSPYRSVLGPLLSYIDKVHIESGREMISVVVPEFVTRLWYQQFLHNQMSLVLKAMLRFKPGKVVTAIRYYI